MIHNFKNNYVAGEIFTSATCNLNCKYCYIPKNDFMKSIDAEILNKLKSDNYVEDLKRVFGDNLEHLSLWGAEPSLTIDKMSDVLQNIVDEFPKLRSIGFSSNFINISKLRKFFKTVSFSRNINLEIQISLDGPAFITDRNRMDGASRIIKDNIGKFSKFISGVDLKSKNINLTFKFKPTFDAYNIKMMSGRPDLIREYFDFFYDIYSSTKEKILISNYMTLAIPGEYIKEDGENFAELLENARMILKLNDSHSDVIGRVFSTYTYRYKRLLDLGEDFFDKPRMFTCSGGRSQLQIGKDGEMHICHRTLFLNYDNYISAVKSENDLENRDDALIKNNQIDNVRKNYIVKKGDDAGERRFFYLQSLYHNYWEFKTFSTTSIIMEMAYSGYIKKKFEDPTEAASLAMFINSVTACHVENLLNTSSMFVSKMSIISIFGNGAYEEIVRSLEDIR